ncbi:MAG: hypothetical protein MJ106_07500, partial [Lentisphaeria bacterium]|nr:hypothetical protein [Lentisphaeria bacterium]
MVPSEKKTERPMAANRVASQANAAAEAVVTVLAQCLAAKRPADRCLHDYCAKNHQLGSRDRRIISETLFSVLRWWVWLQKLAPEKFTTDWKNGESELPIHSSDWSPVLSPAWLLENRFELPPSV